MNLRQTLRWGLILVTFLGPRPLCAQVIGRLPYYNRQRTVNNPQQNRPQVPQPAKINFTGTLGKASGSQWIVDSGTDAAPKRWTVKTSRSTNIVATGTAKRDFLHAGLLVQFEAPLDAPATPVDDLKVLFASASRQPGVVPGANSKSRVTGQITAIQDKKLSLRAGSKTLHVELADDPKISVTLNDRAYAAPGDKVTVQGKAYPGETVCEADDIKITFAQPLTARHKPSSTISEGDAPSRSRSSSNAGSGHDVFNP